MAPGTEQFDFELEIAAVIGRGGADIAVADAESHIFGYMIFCDWSARDIQMANATYSARLRARTLPMVLGRLW